MVSGHYTGELKTAVDEAAEKTTGLEGSFYSILTKHGFYDIADETNGLTQWQRDMVPTYNQHRMSALASAISDMIQDYLGNDEYGVLSVKMEEIVNKLDGFLTCTKAQSDAIKMGLGGSGVLAPIAGSAESMYTANAAMMGLNPYDIDILPPLLIGIGGLPISMGSCFMPGHFKPDWSFLYDHENVKSSKIYMASGNLCIGAGIPLNIGGNNKPIVLKQIFSVLTVDENGEPQGDTKGGISEEQFALILSASDKASMDDLSDDEKSVSLNDAQIRHSFYNYMQMSVWGPISYKENWPYYHWGMAAHNSCPEHIKTAICSYLKTNGMSIDNGINPEAGYISYCLKVGMYYRLGYSKPFMFVPLKGDKYILNDKTVKSNTNNKTAIMVEGVPKDSDRANRYFTYIADILSRLTNSANPSDVDMAMRERRVDEANLIYKYVGITGPKYGTALDKINPYCRRVSMVSRNLKSLFAAKILVHENIKKNYPSATNVVIDMQAPDGELTNRTKNIITELARKAGISYLMITSLYRSPEKQGEIMFKQMQRTGQPTVKYGAKGRAVLDEYARVWYKHFGKGDNGLRPKYNKDGSVMTDELGMPIYVQAYAKEPFEPNSAAANEAKNAMIAKCKSYGTDNPISLHTKDEKEVQCVDITTAVAYVKNPKVTEAQLRRFASICYMSSEAYKSTDKGKQDNSYQTLLTNFKAPKGFGPVEDDAALHLEISQTEKSLKEFDSSDLDNARLQPTIEITLSNPNLVNDANWDNAYAKDHNDVISNS